MSVVCAVHSCVSWRGCACVWSKETNKARVLIDLLAERAALSELGLATCGLAKDLVAGCAVDHRLGVREHRRDGNASGALDVHEERVGRGHKPLHLVLARLIGSSRAGHIERREL